MPFESVYYEEGSLDELSVSGFKEFPFVVPRYLKASHEIYGRSPAMTALPDVKMLNEMAKTTIKAAQKQVDPPLLVPDDGFILPVRTVPGGLNFYRSGTRDRICFTISQSSKIYRVTIYYERYRNNGITCKCCTCF
jgi:hypothetical protein